MLKLYFAPIFQLKATSHMRLRAREKRLEKAEPGRDLLHNTLEGPTQYVNVKWM
jgi:hypothetical protein